MLGVEPLRLGVRFADANDLREAGAIGRIVGAELGHALPIGLHQRVGAHIAVVAEIRIRIGIFDAEIVGLDRAAAGDVDRRMRLLQGLRPDIDVAQLGIAAVEGERRVLVPRPHDQLMRLGIFLARQRRNLSVGVVRVHRGANRKAGNEPSAGDIVQHGEFLGDADRRIVERDRVAEHDQRGSRRTARQRGGNQIGRRHQAVSVLMMFVDADAVKTQRFGMLQQIHIFVVKGVTLDRIVEAPIDVDPHGAMFLAKILRQIAPRHEREVSQAHAISSPWSGRSVNPATILLFSRSAPER